MQARKTIRERLEDVGFDNDDLLTQMNFLDPISFEPMNNAVVADDGGTYEKTTALNLIAKKSPGITHTVVTKILHSATVLQKSINDFVIALERAHQHASQANPAPRDVVPQANPAPQATPSSVGYFFRRQPQWREPVLRREVAPPSENPGWRTPDAPPPHVKAAYKAIVTNRAVHEEIVNAKRITDFNNSTLFARELFATACIYNEQTFRALLEEFHLTGLISLYVDQKRTEDFSVIADNFYNDYKAIFDGMSATDRLIINALVLNKSEPITPNLLVRDLVFAGHLKPGPEAESSLYALLERGNLTHLLEQPEPRSRPMMMGGMIV